MTKGLKYDDGKLRMDLIPPEFIEQLAGVLTFGAEKYEDNSWQEVPDGINRYYAATLRHLMRWRKGEECDDESNMHHLAHAACDIMFMLWLDNKDGGKDEPKS